MHEKLLIYEIIKKHFSFTVLSMLNKYEKTATINDIA